MKDLLRPRVEEYYSKRSHAIMKAAIKGETIKVPCFDKEMKIALAKLYALTFAIVERSTKCV